MPAFLHTQTPRAQHRTRHKMDMKCFSASSIASAAAGVLAVAGAVTIACNTGFEGCALCELVTPSTKLRRSSTAIAAGVEQRERHTAHGKSSTGSHSQWEAERYQTMVRAA